MDIEKLEAEVEDAKKQVRYAQDNYEHARDELRSRERDVTELEAKLKDAQKGQGDPCELFALARSVYIK